MSAYTESRTWQEIGNLLPRCYETSRESEKAQACFRTKAFLFRTFQFFDLTGSIEYAPCQNPPTNFTGAGSIAADFSDTLVLRGLIPSDMNGQRELGATFSSSSGTEYSVNGIVPEPTSVVLVAVGLLSFAVFWKWRSRFR